MLKVNVFSIVGRVALTWDAGELVYDRIHPALVAGECVAVDFSGVEILGAPFFNAGLGRLLEDLDRSALDTLLHVENLDPPMALVVRQVLDNSEQYYRDPKMREAVDKALDKFAEETGTL